jgi:uncharacterized membrane protein/photosystem II stability/assembly factor-like uncharacterized protein
MNLTRNKIFSGILIFWLITSILVLLDIQFLYFRAIFSFIFLITIPGLLIMLMLKIRKIGFWEYFVYSIGLGIAFIMFAGLVVNWSNIVLHPNNWGADLTNSKSSFYSGCDIEETELPLSVDNIWIGKDDILYGYYDNELVKSTDNGKTWNTIYKFTEGEGSSRVWVDSKGTIFAGRNNTGKMYMSKDNGNNWVVSLKFVGQNAPLANGKSEGFGTLWNMDEDSLGNLYVGEYGGEWDANCAYIHKSANGGLTWSIAYDSLAYGWPGRHIHMVKVDKKNDYIYATQGDVNERARLIRSVDHGKTWTTLQAGNTDFQYTTMSFFPDYRLFGTDSPNPNKIIRTSDDITFSSIFEVKGKINEYFWSSSTNNNDITFIGTVSEIVGGHPGLYETRDKGDSWCKVKDLGVTTSDFQGVNNISNFSPEGYAYYRDGRNNKTYRFKDIPKPIKGTLSLLEVKDKPLSPYRILVSFNIFLLIFTFIAYKRNPDLEFKLKLPKLDILNGIFLIIPLIFPVLSILGAIILNNNGPNILTMIMLGGIAIYVFISAFLRDNLNEHVFPWAILTMSISLLLMGWLRSWFVSGVDINLEYHIFQLVKSNQQWNMSLFNNAYTACLSVSILPTILSSFIKINDQYIFKLIIQLIFSITPVCVYLFLRRYTKQVFAFMSAIFFMSQPTFMSWWWIPIRQEIALLFFALALLALFNRTIDSIPKNLLLLTFLFSMVVSHYSTTYIAFALSVFTYLICLIFRKTEDKKYFSRIYEKLNLKEKGGMEKRKYYLSGIIVLFFIIFTFLWYAQLTKISNNFVDFTYKTIQNMGKIFSEDVRAGQTSPFEQFNILDKPKDPTLLLKNYTEEITSKYKNKPYMNSYPLEKYKDYKPRVINPRIIPLKISPNVASGIYLIGEIIKKLVKIFITVGVFYLMFFKFKKGGIDMEYILLTVGSFLVLIAVMILPFASIEYDLMRTYQQVLMILSLPAVLGCFVIFKFFKKENLETFVILSVFLFYFLFISAFIPQIVGGPQDSSMQLNNFGRGYDEFYVHKSEIKSASWLFNNRANDELIYADKPASCKLWFFSNVGVNKITGNIFPSTIDKNSYVYSSYTNTIKKRAFVSIKSETISYNFPTEFLNQNKNKIYNNGESEIFK